jgi:hypothetical protein
MNSCSSIEREDEGHLNELADSFPSDFRRVETHAIERFADGRLEENVVRAEKPYARGFHAPGFADDEENDDLAFDPRRSQAARISWRAPAVSERYLSFNLFGGERFR